MPVRTLIILLTSLVLLASCQTFNKEKFVREILQSPQKHLSNYTFSPSSTLLSRVRSPEPFIMTYLRDMDNRPDYSPYQPTPKELKTVGEALDRLPPLTKKVIKDKMVGLYFVNNLYGSGLSDWLIDDRGDLYVILVINPVTLKMNLSEWLTWKENSAFDADRPGETLAVDAGKKYSAFYGILTHESAHGVDYVTHVNPFVEPATLYYDEIRKNKIENPTEFVKGIWRYAGQPYPASDFSWRKKIHFYASKKEDKIPLSRAEECYSQLLSSPFVSLYGSLSWSEDLAEMVMFYHITKVLGQSYVITVSGPDKTSASFRPMENPLVAERLKTIDRFYR